MRALNNTNSSIVIFWKQIKSKIFYTKMFLINLYQPSDNSSN